MRILFLLRQKTEDASNIIFIIRGVYAMKGKKRKHGKGKGNAYQRKQNRYFDKKGIQRVDIMPPKLTASQLAEYINKFTPLMEVANERIREILEHDYMSLAVKRVQEQQERDYFDMFDVNTREDLISRVTAIRVFLADEGSTLEGARKETLQTLYGGKFGNEYNNKQNKFARYDISAIDKEKAEKAFENYRKLEEQWAALIGRQGGAGVYGSENLIIAMYDAEVRGIDSFDVGKDLLEEFEKEQKTSWKPIEDEAEATIAISGVYFDNLTRGLNF